MIARSLEVPRPLRDAVDDIIRFLPRLVGFLLILLIGYLVARLLRAAASKFLTRLGFDRAADRGAAGRALRRARVSATKLVARLVYYAVLLFTAQLAFGVWGPNPVSDLIASVVAWLPKAVVAIIIVVVAGALARGARDLVVGALGALPYARLLANVIAGFLIGLGVVAALNQIGVATSVTVPVLVAVLATVAGILIVGVGGGLVRPMQQRWERWLGLAEAHLPAVREQLRAAAAEREAMPSYPGDVPLVDEPTIIVPMSATDPASRSAHYGQPGGLQGPVAAPQRPAAVGPTRSPAWPPRDAHAMQRIPGAEQRHEGQRSQAGTAADARRGADAQRAAEAQRAADARWVQPAQATASAEQTQVIRPADSAPDSDPGPGPGERSGSGPVSAAGPVSSAGPVSGAGPGSGPAPRSGAASSTGPAGSRGAASSTEPASGPAPAAGGPERWEVADSSPTTPLPNRSDAPDVNRPEPLPDQPEVFDTNPTEPLPNRSAVPERRERPPSQ